MRRIQLKNHPLLYWLARPGYPDGARLVAQTPFLRKALGTFRLQGSCLNAGCGDGLYLPFLESFEAITLIENIDLSPANDLATRHPDSRHRFRRGSVTELPYSDGQFDCCLCTEVIEHVREHAKATSELARVLKPGAILLASVPQTPAPWDPNHARQGYSLQEFSALLQAAGFEVVAHRSCFFLLMRSIMSYWRHPLIRFGRDRIPYLPNVVLNLLARLDGILRLGKPWDLVVLAVRST